MALIKTSIENFTGNPFTEISKQWFLLTAGTPENYNTMTCSWGAMGVIWNVPAITAYVRTSRYTFDFLEKQENFTISFLPEHCRKILSFCGSHSGKDCDKVKETGLTPLIIDGAVTFEEAERVFVCQKVYAQLFSPESFTEQNLLNNFYETDALHKVYIGKILSVYEHEE